MVVQPSGSTMDVSAEPANELAPMAVRPLGRFTFVTVAAANALAATVVTELGAVYTLPVVFFAAGNAISCVLSLLNSTPSSTA